MGNDHKGYNNKNIQLLTLVKPSSYWVAITMFSKQRGEACN